MFCEGVNNSAIKLAGSSSKKCWDSVDMYLQNARIMKENQWQVVEIMEKVLENMRLLHSFILGLVTSVSR